jgi:multiple sugar transport system substrate-binding protein
VKNKSSNVSSKGMRRREFLAATGAVAGAAATGSLALPRHVFAASKTEITFASARFFAKDSMDQVIEKYNASQNAVHVTYRRSICWRANSAFSTPMRSW